MVKLTVGKLASLIIAVSICGVISWLLAANHAAVRLNSNDEGNFEHEGATVSTVRQRVRNEQEIFQAQGDASSVSKGESASLQGAESKIEIIASSTSRSSSSSSDEPTELQASADVDADGYRIKRTQDYYRPFSGAYWSSRQKAKRVFETYAARAKLMLQQSTAEEAKQKWSDDFMNVNAPLAGYTGYLASAEMGNQILGFLSVFTMSIVTGRYFGIEPNGNYMSNKETYTRIWDTTAGGFEWWLPSVQEQHRNLASHNFGSERQMGNKNDAHDSSPGVFNTEQFTCQKLSDFLPRDVGMVKMNVNQYFAPTILRNPNYREILDDAFGDDFFGPLSRFLLVPSAATASIADNFVKQHFMGKFVVGMHIRTGGAWNVPNNQFELFAKAAREMNKLHNPKNKPVAWFVAADKNDARDLFKSTYANEPGVELLFPDSVFGTQDIPHLMQVAFADMLVLAECDKMLASSWSTFSYVAFGMASNPPVLITEEARPQTVSKEKGADEILYAGLPFWSNQRTTWKQNPTSQPCFHFYFNWRVQDVTCFQDWFVDKEWFDGTRFC